MKPNFALNLSHEGIVLLHRSVRNTWTEVGEVLLDDARLRENLAFLRSTAMGLEGKGFGCKLIIPNSQILYREIHAPGPDDDTRRAQIAAALEGETPYQTDDLVFDWKGSGANLWVAIVARETLDEAEEFAVEHRFNPITFVARADDSPDAWEPYFGRSDYSYTFIGADVDLRENPRERAIPEDHESLFAASAEPDFLTAEDFPDDGDDLAAALNVDDEDTADEAEANLFAEDLPEDEELIPPVQPEAEAPPAESTADDGDLPAFSSRRTTATLAAAPSGKRPLSRVAPRIAILGADGEPATPRPAPVITAETEPPLRAGGARIEPLDDTSLRARILADDPQTPGWPARLAGYAMVLKGIAGGATRRLRPAKAEDAAAGPVADPAVDPAGMPDELAGEPILAAVIDAAETDALALPGDEPEAVVPWRSRRVMAISVLAVIGLVGLIYLVMSTGDPVVDGETGHTSTDGTALLTTSPARGVIADNRPRARPDDLELEVARVAPDADPAIPPLRPERRSLFEGRDDPLADLPDTATPVTDLSEEELADIRAAGIDLPTREELDEEGLSGAQSDQLQADIDAGYARTGILEGLRDLPEPLVDQDRDDIFIAAADRALEANDANTLPDFASGPADDPPAKVMSPLSPDTAFDLDERGLVRATAEGALSPYGIYVRAGRPAVTPPTKPETEELVPPNPHAALKPKSRPEDLKTGADAIYVQGKLTLAELQQRRARSRPESLQSVEASADASPSDLAVLTSFQPAHRPSDFSVTVANSRSQLDSTSEATEPIVEDRGPVLPTRANVAKQATIKNAINLAQLNLIGVYGSASDRHALLRLPSGRFVKVKPGDRVDGGQVAAIGVDNLSYVKSGRSRMLKIP
ncbi:MAG: hypothetical protein K8F59_11180 [Rhodobacteraceae bacterium]|nr:hypothetical protein [Paracoccaceae bacterium]